MPIQTSGIFDGGVKVRPAPNHALQADKGKLSRHLRPHIARQLAFAAERGRYTAPWAVSQVRGGDSRWA